VSAVAAAPRAAATARTDRFATPWELAGAALLLVGFLGLWAFTRTYPNYDSYYHLVWGRELLDGLRPSFEAYSAPTEHPLWIALCAVLGLVGEDADRLLVLVTLLSQAALIFGTYRLGGIVFGRWAGLLAAAFVAASASYLLYAARGYVDSPFLAIVVWAGVIEAARGWERGGPRRFAAPACLLALAGLLRPEAWVLAGLYGLWAWPRADRRARLMLAAAVVLPPLIWAGVDAAVTGDPLHSFNATTELADDLGREQGLRAVPGAFVSFLGATVRPPVAALAVIGLVLAWRRPGPRAMRVPLALFAAGVATFLGTGILGLSIIPRYLTVPAIALCLFAGHALAGFTTLPEGDPLRRRWARASGAAAALGVIALAALAPSLGRITEELSFLRASHDSLVALLDDGRVRAAMRCGPLTFPNYRLVPDSRWHLDAPRAAIGARSAARHARGVEVFALTRKGLRRLGFAAGASPTTNVPDPGYRRIAVNARFSAYAACPPAAP
jgi:hypothetical protein